MAEDHGFGRTMTVAALDPLSALDLDPNAGGYFDLGWYDRVKCLVAAWRGLVEIPAARMPDPALQAQITRLLYCECRLLDQARLEEWLGLFSKECAYWIPTDTDDRDPARTVAWEFNDRRRLEERIERLATGRAFSQAPPTRTTHYVTNIEMLTGGPGLVHVLCNFLIQTNLGGRVTQRSGWHGYLFRHEADAWRIVLKRVNLFDADKPQDNNSFTL
jgi:ethylbenzene dioxygenase beta subunit